MNHQDIRSILKDAGIGFAQVAECLGLDEFFIASVLYGQARLSVYQVEKFFIFLNSKIDMGDERQLRDLSCLTEVPERYLPAGIENDPFFYRLLEMMRVYGVPLKATINERHGDGILSAVDCKVTVKSSESNGAIRVALTFDSKFLPYPQW